MLKKRHIVVTSAAITLILTNTANVYAKNQNTSDLHNKQPQETEIVEKEQIDLHKKEESFDITNPSEEQPHKDTNQSSEEMNQQYNLIIEQLNILINEDERALVTALEEVPIDYESFQQAVVLHTNDEFEIAGSLYKDLLLNETRSKKMVSFINILINAANKEKNLLDIDFSSVEKNKEGKLKNTEEDSNEDNVDDSENEIKENKELPTDVQEMSKQAVFAQTSPELKAKTSDLPTDLIEKKSNHLPIADAIYNDLMSSNSVSERWDLAQQFVQLFREDSRVSEVVDFATNSQLNYAERLHQSNNFKSAVIYYQRVLKTPLINETTERRAQLNLTLAETNNKLLKPDELYLELINSGSVSERWNLAQLFVQMFKEDARATEVINFAANSQLNFAERLHKNQDFSSAIIYYNRILSAPLISETIQKRVEINKTQAENRAEILTADSLFTRLMNSSSVSQRWNLALQFVQLFSNDARASEALNFVASSQLNYAQRLHKNEDFKSAVIYYERIIAHPLVNKSNYEQAEAYLQQAIEQRDLQTADDLYTATKSSDSVTERWTLSREFKHAFPNDSRVKELLNFSTNSQLNYGERLHRDGKFNSAISYYDRILAEPNIQSITQERAQSYRQQALQQRDLETADNLYATARNSNSVSERWDLALQFKESFPSDARLKGLINFAANSQLNYAIRLHRNKNFNTASSYYRRLMNEELIDYASRYKAEIYNQLAENNLTLTNLIINHTNYSVELERAIDIQLSVDAQASTTNGGWRNATKKEVREYINPNNFLPDDLSNIGATLFTVTITTDQLNVRTGPSTDYNVIGQVRKNEHYTILDVDNGWYMIESRSGLGWISGATTLVDRKDDILQFLVLSGTSGVTNSDLNALLEGAGNLENMASAFRRASQEANVNEIYLVSHALLETGRGKSDLATGIVVDTVDGKAVTPRKVYNMYGIGATDDNPNKFGSERAYKLGWFTPEEAIIGGAQWISSSYINNRTYQQDTLYKMRWNPNTPGTHQYATDVGWAAKQTGTLNNLVDLSRRYGLILRFDIPIYK